MTPESKGEMTTRPVEEAISAMREETIREIQKEHISPEAKLAWYWTYIGSLDMAQELGLIVDDRRQELYREIYPYKPGCEVTMKAEVQQAEKQTSAPQIADGLPELCFSVLRNTGALICIKRGERGCYRSDWDTGDPAKNQELADYNNQRLGVTDAQRKAMEAGSMFGWGCPAADPKTHEQESGTPAEARQSGFDGERSRSEMSELSPQEEANDTELSATMGGEMRFE